MKQASLAAVLAASVALSGCAFIHAAQQGYHQSFRTSFKKSFVSSCTARPGTNADYCGCAADDIESRYTDDQLMSMAATESDQMRDALSHAQKQCASKLAQ